MAAIDLFCGAGGLSYGLRRAGVNVIAGVDIDPTCQFPFEHNTGARFLLRNISALAAEELAALFPSDSLRLLAGCAPCSPFSPFRHGQDTSKDEKWGLLGEFRRLAKEVRPDLVTMENVPGLASRPIFDSFVRELKDSGYHIAWRSLYCPQYRIPQRRRRLVLIGSLAEPVQLPAPRLLNESQFRTVRQTIALLPAISAGAADDQDPLHKARALSKLNLQRIQVSTPGGTWQDWPKDLRSPCHNRTSGQTFRNVYSRMSWDEPAPTITTQAFNFGTGRFGHPEQDRSLTLREAALLQTFPRRYKFVPEGESPEFTNVGRLIGNAVPPRLGYYIGLEIMRAAEAAAG